MDSLFKVDVTLATSEEDITPLLQEAKENFYHGDMERSGHHFLQAFRIMRGNYDQDGVKYTREYFQCTVQEYSRLFAEDLHGKRKLQAQILHDAAMAYFVDRRKRSKALGEGPYKDAKLQRLSIDQQDVSLALPYYCSSLHTTAELKSGENTSQAVVSMANIIPVTDVIGRAINSVEDSVDIACIIARYCILEYSGNDTIPSWMISDLSWIILHSTRDQIWVKHWALPTLKNICRESEKDGNSLIEWFLKSKEVAELDPSQLTIGR